MNKILETYSNGRLALKNRLVMAAMTRSRAIGNVPNEWWNIMSKDPEQD